MPSFNIPDPFLWTVLIACAVAFVWGVSPWVMSGFSWVSDLRIRNSLYKIRQGGGSSSIEFFATLDELEIRQPLSDTFKPGNKIHALFLTGESVILSSEDYIKCVERLILPDPHEDNFGDLAKQTHDYHAAKGQFASQVRAALAKAKKNGIEVKTTDNFVGCSMIFCNPESNDGWVLIGPIIPGTTPAKRQHYRLYKATHEEAFRAMHDTFERLWDPPAEREFKAGFNHSRNGIRSNI